MVATIKSKAVLLRKIQYNKDGIAIVIPKGTEIEVDQHQNIGLYKDDHFEIRTKEYRILFPH